MRYSILQPVNGPLRTSQRTPQQLQPRSTSSSILQIQKLTQAGPQLIRTATIWTCRHLFLSWEQLWLLQRQQHRQRCIRRRTRHSSNHVRGQRRCPVGGFC
jgi:hypothetical protein